MDAHWEVTRQLGPLRRITYLLLADAPAFAMPRLAK